MNGIDDLHYRFVFLTDSDYNLKRRKFFGNLLKRKKAWPFKLVIDIYINMTNERAKLFLRPSMIFRKVSDTRTKRVAEIYHTLNSIHYTTKLRKTEFHKGCSRNSIIRELISGKESCQ